MNLLYQRPARITYYDLDCFGKLKLSALLRMVHIAADANARELGAGYDVLAPLGMTFVLQRFGVSCFRMPAYYEDVIIRTWPSDVAKGTFLRRGDMYDAKGEKIMEWASLWLLFDINARKPLKPTALPNPFSTLGDEGVVIMPDKVLLPADGQPFSQYRHIVSYRDVDTNMHMNNSIYGDLIGNAIFSAGSDANMPDWTQIQINYLAEMRIGVEAEIKALRDDNGCVVIGESGGRKAFTARVTR